MLNIKKLSVLKLDGNIVPFDKERIVNAVISAVRAVRGSGGVIENRDFEMAGRISKAVHSKMKAAAQDPVTVKQIHHEVEALLMDYDKEVATAYIQYRHDRDKNRELGSRLHQSISGLMDASDVETMNENANKDSREIPTRRDQLAGAISKHYALEHVLPKRVVKAHISGDIHFHDADYSPFFPMVNCCLVDVKGMMSNGYKLGGAQVETPKSIGTACAQVAQIIARVASCNYGGTSINDLDIVLEPYVAATRAKYDQMAFDYCVYDNNFVDDMTRKAVYDAIQGLEYEINTLYTSNGQTPFVTLGFGKGKSQDAQLVTESILKVRIQGIGKEQLTPVFPKLVYNVGEGHNQNVSDPQYYLKKLALECSTKRMYPDILNMSFGLPTSMGCRSFLNEYFDEQGNLVYDGRCNLGVVTVNLPRIAIEAKGDLTKFKRILDERLEVCYDALMARIDSLKGVKAEVAPILYCEGAFGVRLKPEDEIIDIFKNGRASISLGYIGLHEVVTALFPDEDHTFDSDVKREYSISLLEYLKETTEMWKEQSGWGFSLYGTPSENLCGRFCKLDLEKFGAVKGVNDKKYYTNSFHLDVAKNVTPYQKFDFERPYVDISNGGNIVYAEYPNMAKNPQALEQCWDYALRNGIRYFGSNQPIDSDSCGWTGEALCTSKGFECPSCGNTGEGLHTTRRVCGYLGSPDERPFNEGKQAEVMQRVKHTGEEL
ncbi:anaerobic ribonucleoside-triphosphate reductase [Vibrio phage 1.244.A._10N.261.54.C3]|nr:anaerobic ribonucleoside-triphosphate reductase [Vibrio phage 1.244.A._10N.261.54.C3]AUR98682.1 anaerobic ribonucleoside-triphosphate reductase [Vibrio phage 1.255.O._10N.286.45.F1]